MTGGGARVLSAQSVYIGVALLMFGGWVVIAVNFDPC